ncbi:MAG: glycoside hydrolase family 9 protein [Candidatus Omnitrophica bacterium]|nr:glycoside hydrolase family 9 protein [Candidatus Omnitrophota bacterium]MCM8777615.1 glycoside hydrolase family 9 protein [Candidatus Omnitrophota bacterium]
MLKKIKFLGSCKPAFYHCEVMRAPKDISKKNCYCKRRLTMPVVNKYLLFLTFLLIFCKLGFAEGMDVNNYYEVETGNVILNPSFEFFDEKGTPLFWFKRPFTEADVSVTKEVKKHKEFSLCISNSDPDFYLQNIAVIDIDYSYGYTIDFWVKAENVTGENYLEVEIARNGNLKKSGSTPWDILGTFKSENLTGNFDWKKISLDIKPPKYSMYLLIRFISRNNKGRLYLDGFYLNGYGSAPVEIIINQAGFHPDGLKDGVVRTKEKYSDGTFEIINAQGETVYKNSLVYLCQYKFGEHYYSFDFTEFKKEGKYKIKIDFGEGITYLYPDYFEIDKKIYQKLWEFSLKHLQHARCGYEVPGWFKPAYLDDAAIYTDRFNGKKIGHQDLTGGWFDAGDTNKFNENSGIVTWELIKSFELMFSPEEAKDNINHDVVKEGEWGAKYLLKLYDGKGGFWGAVRDPANTMKTPFWENTDNIPDTPDDRIVFPISLGNREIILGLVQYINFCKKYNYKISEIDPYIKVIKEALPLALIKPLSQRIYEDADPYLIPIGKLMMEIIGEEKYQQDSKKIANQLEVEIREEEYLQQAFRNKNPAIYLYKIIFDSSLPFHFIYFLLEYAELFPEDELTPKIKETVGKFIEKELVPLSKKELTPIGHTFYWDPLKHQGKAISSPNRNNIYQIGVAYIFAKAARVLNKKEYLALAEKNIGWILGRNYCAGSSLVGIGHRQLACYADWLRHCPGHEDSYLPGGICKGIGVGNGVLNNDFKEIMQNPIKGVCMPEGFPFMHSFPSKDCPVYQTNGLTEVWIRVTGAFLLACGEIEKSIREMGR